ncbi:MAG: class A beta-lactamase [Deltaproteobacteria bacterium]
MNTIETRRHFLSAALGTLASACVHSQPGRSMASADELQSIRQIESKTGGRLGVFALDMQTGRQLASRADERFAMCSTFKWVLAAQVLAGVDRSQWSLDQNVGYGSRDLLEYAPATKEHVARGYMTVEELARAAVVVSDNTAANLLLSKLGGPEGLTQFTRALGDRTTRLDRIEPALNSNEPGDVRDTTSPRAMVLLMNRILCGDALSPSSRQRLIGWLQACETGKARLRAGLPSEWAAGDKTGTGNNGACNDVAMAVPAGRAPVLIAVYLSDGHEKIEVLEAAHADVARIIAGHI